MTSAGAGRLIGIARRERGRAPMEDMLEGAISVDGGLAGDHRGAKYPRRRITVLAIEDWQAALADLGAGGTAPALPWTTRRANLLVSGVRLPRARGALLRVGPVELEVTGETNPCHRMDEAHLGLLKALHPGWRGGVTCAVRAGGPIRIGDPVSIVSSPPDEVRPKLP